MNLSAFLSDFVQGLTSASVLTALILFWVKERIKKSTTAELEKYKAELKNTSDIQLRKFEAKLLEQEKMSIYIDSFLHSLNDLQSRIYHLIQNDMATKYYLEQPEDSAKKDYIVNNTTFLIAQYFAWLEKIRTEVQYLKLSDNEQNRAIARLLDSTVTTWQKPLGNDDGFAVLAGNQRAIGEVMLVQKDSQMFCMGYGQYLMDYADKQNPIILNLEIDVLEMLGNLTQSKQRLVDIHSELIDIILTLDVEEKLDRACLQKLS